MKIINIPLPTTKYKIKSPYSMNSTRIVVHNTANDASARNEVNYMISNNRQVSFHVAIDDKEVVTSIPFNRNAYHAGDGSGKGNREGIGIEICYSKSGGDRFLKSEKLAAEYIALLLKKYGWGIEKVTKHQDYSKKYCPHRTLDLGWDRFLKMIQLYLKPTVANKVVNKINPLVYTRPRYNGGSLSEALRLIKVNNSFANRKKIAIKNGIKNYSGTASQNIYLLNLLKYGKLRRV